jgi:hypothetical protein
MSKRLLILSLALILSVRLWAQEDLMQLLETDSAQIPRREYIPATFKGTRIINGHSVETPAGGVLQFLISHRFGTLNSGAYNLFGLDQATIRLGLEYGLTDRFTVGIGRSSLEKTYDGFLKYKLLRQSRGAVTMPFTVVAFGSAALTSLRFPQPAIDAYFAGRLTYTGQVLIARKFSPAFSLQLMPTFIHRNLVASPADPHDVGALGIAGRHKLTRRISLSAEYYYLLPGKTADNFYNSFSLGFDIETGGHVFQLHLTNSPGMIEKFFIPQTTGSWGRGDIYFGFNISRVFTLRQRE